MWYFYAPKVIFGEDALNFIEKIEGKKCFIVSDKTIEQLGYLKILTDKLKQYGKNFADFSGLGGFDRGYVYVWF